MLQEPFLQCRVFEEEGLEAVILAINTVKMWIARNSQTNSNCLVLKENRGCTRYGVTISYIRPSAFICGWFYAAARCAGLSFNRSRAFFS